MKNLNLSAFVVLVLVAVVMACQQPPNRIRGNSSTKEAQLRAASAEPATPEAKALVAKDISQLLPYDTILVELLYLGYNQSPSKDSKVYLGASLSATDGLAGQKELFRDYAEITQDFPGGTRGAKFTMRFPWVDIQNDLSQIGSDSTKPFYFGWKFTPAGGKSTDLFSVDLSSRIKNALANPRAEVEASVKTAKYDLAHVMPNPDLAKAFQTLTLDDHLAEIYPMVGVEVGSPNSFAYVGMSVSIERGPDATPAPSPTPGALAK